VDVVVPFRGTPAQLGALLASLDTLDLAPGDSLVVVDNTPSASATGQHSSGRVITAAGVAAPGFARNRGAASGRAPWLVFFDADTVALDGLLDCYFDPLPAERTGLLAGGVRDEEVPPRGPVVARYAYVSGAMSQANTMGNGAWAFPQAANLACRRKAFEEVGGFREDIRAGEDADLTFRLREGGWGLEERDAAAVMHRSRQTVRSFVRQKAIHGAGAAWISDHYPGALPARRRPGLTWWGIRRCGRGLGVAARRRDRDEALEALLEPVEQLSFEFGRSLPNRPRRQ